MSDFVVWSNRLHQRGITKLWVQMDIDGEERIMHVSPALDMRTLPEARCEMQMRTFSIDGTDRVLERLKDDMAYSEGGPTAEKIKAAIEKSPEHAEDLREWYADWLLNPPASEEELSNIEVSERDMELSNARIKGLLQGLDAARSRKAASRI